jgi:hypothetical protein
MKKLLPVLFGPLVFACGSLSAQTYLTADFETGMPAGWTANPSAGAWVVPGVNSSGFTPPAHTVFCAINDDASQTSANSASTITTPVINLSSASVVFLKYDCFYGGLTYQSITEVADLLYSTDGGSTYTSYGNLPTSTAGWTTNSINLSTQLAGQANVKIQWRYNDGGGWLYGAAIDNVSVLTPVANDASLTAVTPVAGSPSSYGMTGSNINIGGTITNEGLSAITSIAVKYSNGTSTYTDNISSVNIASFATYNFTHNVPYNIPSAGTHPITVWVELSGDANHSNDTLGTIINGVMFIPTHHVTVEEGTGTWCGWCVRGMVYLDSMRAVHPYDCDLIAVHNADPMTDATYDAGVGTLIAGYPSTLVNRDLVSDPQNIFDDYTNTIGDFGYADLMPTVTFNNATRVATVNVSAHFAVGLTGDYRLACVFTEDNVHNTAGGQWDQHNYYSFQSQNIPLVDNESGMDFQALPQVIPSAQVYYNFVARTILGGFNGQVGSLPSTIPAGSTQNYTFTYTIPAGYNVWLMHVKVLLIDNTTASKHIMNSAGVWTPLAVESPDASPLNGVQVYPNPVNQNMNVAVTMANSENVTVEMFDMTGKLISSENEGQLSLGEHIISIDGSSLANGMYLVKVTAGTSVVTQKISVAH